MFLPDEFHQALLQIDFGAVKVVQLGGRPQVNGLFVLRELP